MLFGKVDTLFLERIDESVLPFCISHDFMVDIFGVFQILFIPPFRERPPLLNAGGGPIYYIRC